MSIVAASVLSGLSDMALTIFAILFSAEHLISARILEHRHESKYRAICDSRLEALCRRGA